MTVRTTGFVRHYIAIVGDAAGGDLMREKVYSNELERESAVELVLRLLALDPVFRDPKY